MAFFDSFKNFFGNKAPQIPQTSIGNISTVSAPPIQPVQPIQTLATPSVTQNVQQANTQQNDGLTTERRAMLMSQLEGIQTQITGLQKERIDTPISPDFDADSFDSAGLVNTTSSKELERNRRQKEIDTIRENLLTPSDREIELQEQFTRATDALAREENRFTRQESDIEFNVEGLFGTGQDVRGGQISREKALQLGARRNIQEGLLDALSVEQNLRGAKVDDLIKLQGLTTPELVGAPQINAATGEVTGFQRDPFTGAVTTVSMGQIEVDPTFDIQSIITNEATGQKFAVGMKAGDVLKFEAPSGAS